MNAEGPSYERLRKNWGMGKVARGTGAPVKLRNFKSHIFGGLAQLVEHNICNVGVRGSNPLSSTTIQE